MWTESNGEKLKTPFWNKVTAQTFVYRQMFINVETLILKALQNEVTFVLMNQTFSNSISAAKDCDPIE